MNMKKFIYMIIGYTIGYTIINFAIPEKTFTNFVLVTVGGCIITITTLLYNEHTKKNE